MKDRDFIAYIFALVSFFLIVGWYFRGTGKPQDITEQEAFRVRAVEVQSGMSVWVNGPGRITDDTVLEIIAHVPCVISYLAEPGVILEEGDPVLILTPSDGRSLEAARLHMENKVKERDGQEKAQRAVAMEISEAKRSCTVEEYIARAASVVRARVDAAKAIAEYEACKQALLVVAPCRGYFVLPRTPSGAISQGSYVAQGTHLGRFVKHSKDVYVEVTLSQQECSNVEIEQPAVLTLNTPAGPIPLDGRVAGVDRSSDAAIYGTKVRVLCPSLTDTELKYCTPGADGNVAILVQKLACFLVEEAAIMEGWLVVKVTPTKHGRGFAQLVPIEIIAHAYGYVGFVLKYPQAHQLKAGDLLALDHPLTGWRDTQGGYSANVPVTIAQIGVTTYGMRNVQIFSSSAQGESNSKVAA